MLIEGYKFDLRVYVLVTGSDPLRIFLYKDGLVRLSTIKYEKPTNKNISKLLMHLTNYSLNKHSKKFKENPNDIKGQGFKRSLI